MSATDTPTLRFLGAAGTVTGSMHLVTAGNRRILLDCGLFQGLKDLRRRNWAPRIDPRSVDAVVLSHAHLDHSGYLPILARDGLRGDVVCTGPTAELLSLLLPDSAHLLEEEAEHANFKGYSKHRPALPLYTVADARAALERLAPRRFDSSIPIAFGTTARLRCAGHILGAATVTLEVASGRRPLRLVYSGDLGRWDRPVLRDPELVEEADVLVLESTYGNRVHPGDAEETLARSVREGAQRGGAILVPAFAVDRTQELLWMLGRLEEDGRIPPLPVYLDSPMAIDVTTIYDRHPEELQPALRGRLRPGDAGRWAKRCQVARTPEQSKAINQLVGPIIVISASGMATGGRILHHLSLRLADPRTTVLMVGFQAAGTRGCALAEGARSVRIFGRDVPVLASVERLDALSAHADRDETLRWLRGFRRPPRITYLVHGEPESAAALAETIGRQLGWTVRVATDGETVSLA